MCLIVFVFCFKWVCVVYMFRDDVAWFVVCVLCVFVCVRVCAFLRVLCLLALFRVDCVVLYRLFLCACLRFCVSV